MSLITCVGNTSRSVQKENDLSSDRETEEDRGIQSGKKINYKNKSPILIEQTMHRKMQQRERKMKALLGKLRDRGGLQEKPGSGYPRTEQHK